MSSLKRYDYVMKYRSGRMEREECVAGELVSYDDHLDVVQALEARVEKLEAELKSTKANLWSYPSVRIGKNVSIALDDVLIVCGAITSEAFMRHSLTFSPGYRAAKRIRENIGPIYFDDPNAIAAERPTGPCCGGDYDES